MINIIQCKRVCNQKIRKSKYNLRQYVKRTLSLKFIFLIYIFNIQCLDLKLYD